MHGGCRGNNLPSLLTNKKQIKKYKYLQHPLLIMVNQPEKAIPACPKCGKSYGINKRKDGTIRCKLCGYEGEIPKKE